LARKDAKHVWELIFDKKGMIQDRAFAHYVGRKEIKELVGKERLESIELTERSGKRISDPK